MDSVNLIRMETFFNNRFFVGVEVLYWTLVKSIKEYIFTLSEGIFYRIPREHIALFSFGIYTVIYDCTETKEGC